MREVGNVKFKNQFEFGELNYKANHRKKKTLKRRPLIVTFFWKELRGSWTCKPSLFNVYCNYIF